MTYEFECDNCRNRFILTVWYKKEFWDDGEQVLEAGVIKDRLCQECFEELEEYDIGEDGYWWDKAVQIIDIEYFHERTSN